MWSVETIVNLTTNKTVGYAVQNQIGGDANLPIDLIFHNKDDAEKLALWLNKKDNWADRLEYIIENELENMDLDTMKEKFGL